MISADDIRNHIFETDENGNYLKKGVDDYKSSLADEYDTVVKENKELARRLTVFAKKLGEYKNNDKYMTDTIMSAQKTASQTISGAESVVAKMIEASKNEGRNIINAAKEKAKESYAERDKIITEAQATAKEILENAQKAAEETAKKANSKADSIISEAEEQANDKIREAGDAADKRLAEAEKEAQARIDSLTLDIQREKQQADELRSQSFEVKRRRHEGKFTCRGGEGKSRLDNSQSGRIFRNSY